VGSANLNARSLRFDYEANAVIVDSCVTRQLDHIFDNDKSKSFLLTPESWNRFRTRWQKTVGWFAHLLSAWL
jgi:cardiolipin synthase